MGRVLTNATGLNYAVETALGTPGTKWYALERNDTGTFGPQISTTVRDPISQIRQKRKGAITDLDSQVEFEHDLTFGVLRDFARAFLFTKGKNHDWTDIKPTSVTSANGFAVPSGRRSALKVGHLFYGRGFANEANNGLKVLTDAVTSTVNAANTRNLKFSSPAAETPSPSPRGSNARISLAGMRISRPTWNWDDTNKLGTLGKSGQFAGSLLSVGQRVHLGSPNKAGNMRNGLSSNKAGWGRVMSITNDAIVLDKLSGDLRGDETSVSNTVDLLFGQFASNTSYDDDSDDGYLEQSFTFEASYPGLGDGSENSVVPAYEYAVGNYCNSLGINLPLTDKATCSFSFEGTDTPVPTTTRKAGADAYEQLVGTSAYDTTANVVRLSVERLDEEGLSTDFKNLSITLNNSVSPEKVVGKLGARYMNVGMLEVAIDGELVFTDPRVVAAVRSDTSVSVDFVIANNDGAISFDVPSIMLSDSDRSFPVNESVLVNLNGMAFVDERLNTSLGISFVPVPGLSG